MAYYVIKVEGQYSFSPKEMVKWFLLCGFPKPSQMTVALFDAKRMDATRQYGYIKNVKYGNWLITYRGENLVIRRSEESDIALPSRGMS